MTEYYPIKLTRVDAVPSRIGSTSSRYDPLIKNFFNSGWNAAEVTGYRQKRAGNVRTQLTERIGRMGLKGHVVANVRADRVYLARVQPARKRREVVVEAGVGVKKGRVLDDEMTA